MHANSSSRTTTLALGLLVLVSGTAIGGDKDKEDVGELIGVVSCPACKLRDEPPGVVADFVLSKLVDGNSSYNFDQWKVLGIGVRSSHPTSQAFVDTYTAFDPVRTYHVGDGVPHEGELARGADPSLVGCWGWLVLKHTSGATMNTRCFKHVEFESCPDKTKPSQCVERATKAKKTKK